MAEDGGRFAGKVAIVTGAAHGIGAEIAGMLLAESAHVVLADVVTDEIHRRQDEYGDSRVLAVGCDVSRPDQVASLMARAEETFGGLDILVNNAGLGAMAPIDGMSEEQWQRVISVNLGGVLSGIRFAAPAMRRRGGGAIVNLSSIAAHRAMLGMSAYAAAKAGVEAATRCAALELRDAGIRVNAVAPALVHSDAAARSTPVLERAIGLPMEEFLARRQERWGEPREVAGVVLHLASDEASFTTGQTYVVDNGASMLL